MTATNTGGEPHYDVASYALGLFDDAEATAFEEHLAACDGCAADLESFLPVVALLPEARLSPAGPPPRPADPPDELADRRAGRSTRHHPIPATGAAGGTRGLIASARGALRRPVVAAAVAAVIAAGATVAVFGAVGPRGVLTTPAVSTEPAAPPPWNALEGPDLGTGQQLEASDERSGVHGQVVLESEPWGTRVSFALWQLVGPQECRLVVVRRGGGVQALSTWAVPPAGYGLPDQRDPLVLQAATSIDRAQIQAIVVESVGNGGTRLLLTVTP